MLTLLSNTAFLLFMAPCATDMCVQTADLMSTVAEQEECDGVTNVLNTYADPSKEYWFCMEVFLGPDTQLITFSEYTAD